MERRVFLNEELIKSLDSVMDRNWSRLRKETGISRSTFYRMKGAPTGINMEQLLAIANGLKIPVSHFFYTGNTHTVGKKVDYVTEPYLQCHYDYETLRHIIGNRRDITWVKGYEYTGITEDNLKNSLMKDDVPVNRLLDFCNGFGTDPFTVIIDPNPKERPKRRKADDTALLAEVASMRKEIDKLTATANALSDSYKDLASKYDSISDKYDALLSAHKGVLKQLNDHVESSYIGMAAEPDNRR